MICNAHLDPEWLWEWEEGAAAMLGTFRQAAAFCDEYEGEDFVFNHNVFINYDTGLTKCLFTVAK